jgi:hypothetical protein
MGDFSDTKEFDMPLHMELAMRKAELAAQEMTWDQLQIALLNLYYQRLMETQAIKDLLKEENIDLEFDNPTDIELTHLALKMMASEECDDDEDDGIPYPF